jgi:hypothetical protein
MEAAKPERRFGRKHLSEQGVASGRLSSPRANILDMVGVTGAPARQKALEPSKVLILGHLRSHSPKQARAITVIHCIPFHLPDDAGANDIPKLPI